MTRSNRQKPARIWTVVTLSLGLSIGLLTAPDRSVAGDGVQFSGDCFSTYVNKKVGNEQWAITWEIDGNATGNVFMLDGKPAAQIECDWIDGDEFTQTFDCYGSSACAGPPCGGSQWTLIASNHSIPTSFFLPPGVDLSDPYSACQER